ncbi:lipase secretion chaperone [Paraburkholderia acidicola]|nr:lipase secretion chaperone [Paraburkholderia acidicola]
MRLPLPAIAACGVAGAIALISLYAVHPFREGNRAPEIALAQAGGDSRPATAQPVYAAHPAIRPASLAGVPVPDGLRADSHGDLIRDKALRDYFDYFLAAQDELKSDERLRQFVRGDMETRIQGAALSQAEDLWDRYRRYLAEASTPAQGAVGDATQLDGVERALAARESLQSRDLPDVASAWFGDENRHAEFSLAQMRIASDTSLSADERKRQLEALNAGLPKNEQTQLAAAGKPAALGKLIAGMNAQGATDDAIASRIATDFGADVAQRYLQSRQQDTQWKNRYDGYAVQRDAIRQQPGLSDAERTQQIDALRQQYFGDRTEVLHAYLSDAGNR